MLSYTGRRQEWQDITNASDSNTLNLGDRLMNQSEKRILASKDWPFLEFEDTSLTTTSGTQFYNIPQLNGKFKSIYVNISSFRWVPRLITLRDEWDRINLLTTNYKSDFPLFFYIFNQQVGIFPTPNSSGNTIGLIYKKIVKDLTVADITSPGSILTATNGSTAIVGGSTTFPVNLGAGYYLKITDGTGTNSGDGFWYQIASRQSNTALTLNRPYVGTSIAAGTTAYTIGQMSAFPEGYTDLPVFDGARQYFATVSPDPVKFKLYDGMFKELCKQMDDEQSDKQASPVLDDGETPYTPTNPNLLIMSPGP